MKKLLFSIVMVVTAIYAEEVYATFQVEAEKSAELAFSSSGIVEKVHVEVGRAGKKEDVLATLENSVLGR